MSVRPLYASTYVLYELTNIHRKVVKLGGPPLCDTKLEKGFFSYLGYDGTPMRDNHICMYLIRVVPCRSLGLISAGLCIHPPAMGREEGGVVVTII